MPVSTIFIVDEYPAHIEGVAQALSQVGGIDVIGTATSGADLLASIDSQRPDVVLIEPWMRSGDGLDAMAQISKSEPGIAMIALSRMWDDDHVARAFEVGASGFMRKDAGTTDLASLIGYVERGGMVRPAVNGKATTGSDLTRREREVLSRAASGMSNREVGAALYVTEQTVKFHLGNIYRKLGVHNRTEAAHAAAKLGLLGS